jgi:type II secretory pathway pseudopilin PulG
LTLVEVVMALAITGITIGGIVSGYIYCTNANTKDALTVAANAQAQQRLEQARAARWDISSYPVVDQLVTNNFPDVNVVLDQDNLAVGSTAATVKTDITLISTNPPLKRIHVDCIWLFQSNVVINSLETCRAPDQ